MSIQDIKSISQIYLKRFETRPPQVLTPILPDTKIIIVIPCYNEPDILSTLQSLAQAEAPLQPVELLIVINAGRNDSQEVLLQNQRSRQQIQQWTVTHMPDFLRCHIVNAEDLPSKHAGVGLARKIGMDEALQRFASIGYDGFIMNLDADCTVASNYFLALEKTWLTQSPDSCLVYFEHDLKTIEDQALKEGIIYYELFLRYYINGLRYAGFPFAFHTVGSCMGARTSTYALSGGMNRRKAGEDFYFLHKVGPLGTVVQLNSTTVYPSARVSDRVPFGTGKAQQDWLEQSDRHRYLYNPEIFEELRTFLRRIPVWYEASLSWEQVKDSSLPHAWDEFLGKQNFGSVWNHLSHTTRSWDAFQKRIFAWLDGFRVLKFIHFARDHYYQSLPAEKSGFTLLQKLRILSAEEVSTAEELLYIFRNLDRQSY